MRDVRLEEITERPRLRVDLLTPQIEVVVGEPVTVSLRIVNTTSVIETVRIELLALLAETTHQHPEQITLFPEESLDAELELTFARALPAGTHEGLLVVTGGSGTTAPTELPLLVEVPSGPALDCTVEPPQRTGGRRERFELLLDNIGNTSLDVRLRAVDANRVCQLSFTRPRQTLRAAQASQVDLVVQAKRQWTGAPTDHTITVTADAGEVVETAEVLYRQKAVLTPGVITVLTLLLIVGAWAAIMLFGVERVFTEPPLTKAVPAGFTDGIGLDTLDPLIVGGGLAGAVVADSTGAPVERVTVEVFAADGSLVGATATAEDGTYELDGLLPGRYRLRLRATGFTERWWPDAVDPAGATELLVDPDTLADARVTALVGAPAALGGTVVAGDGDVVAAAVELVALDLTEPIAPIQAATDDGGVWQVDALPAPATYEITVTAPGYAPVVTTEAVEAGDQRTANPIRLPAAPGGIDGLVFDRDGTALGGVEVVAQRGDDTQSTTTPTSGEIGSFVFTDLPTPGTYLLTFTAEGFASETQGVRLEAGQTLEGLTVTLAPATGVVTGVVVDTSGAPLGGVTVTAAGGDVRQSTDTLTSGEVGSFRLSGLPLPGTYTLDFDLDGFSRETVRITIDAETPVGTASARLAPSVGRLEGQVLDAAGAPVIGAQVAITDGETVRQTTTASAPTAQRGRFAVGQLPVGAYTVTATLDDGRTFTVLESVQAGATVTTELRVPAS